MVECSIIFRAAVHIEFRDLSILEYGASSLWQVKALSTLWEPSRSAQGNGTLRDFGWRIHIKKQLVCTKHAQKP
jgi:hypothetical protein